MRRKISSQAVARAREQTQANFLIVEALPCTTHSRAIRQRFTNAHTAAIDDRSLRMRCEEVRNRSVVHI